MLDDCAFKPCDRNWLWMIFFEIMIEWTKRTLCILFEKDHSLLRLVFNCTFWWIFSFSSPIFIFSSRFIFIIFWGIQNICSLVSKITKFFEAAMILYCQIIYIYFARHVKLMSSSMAFTISALKCLVVWTRVKCHLSWKFVHSSIVMTEFIELSYNKSFLRFQTMLIKMETRQKWKCVN